MADRPIGWDEVQSAAAGLQHEIVIPPVEQHKPLSSLDIHYCSLLDSPTSVWSAVGESLWVSSIFASKAVREPPISCGILLDASLIQ